MKKMTTAVITLALAVALGPVLIAQAPPPAAAKPRPPQSFPMFLQGQYDTLKRNITGSAEKMPVEHFSFRPAPEVMTYAELIAHVLDVQYSYCAAVKGVANPAIGKDLVKTTTGKPAVIQLVKDSFAFCDEAIAALTNANALEMITVGAAPNQRQIARANQLTMLVVHGNEHYGNLVTYMRMKGIVPPSSAQ
jgi:uncharacterized damage-inducible protein DinB